MRRITTITTAGLALLLFVSGCRHCARKKCNDCNGPAPVGAAGVPFTGATLPPQNLPIDRGPPPNRAPAEVLTPDPTGAPPVPGDPSRGMSRDKIRAYKPDDRPAADLGKPEFGTIVNPAPLFVPGQKPAETKEAPPEPRPAEPSAPEARLPVGIGDYAVVSDGISTGMRPDLEGLDWLRDQKTRTVVYLHAPKDDPIADQQQVTKRGMAFVPLAIPSALDAATVEQFRKLVADAQGRPLFVYDRAGDYTGSMWYLHFRQTMKDEAARAEAPGVGLRDTGTKEQAAVWAAAQKMGAE